MAEDYTGVPRDDNKALSAIGRQIRYSDVLKPWMRAYAEWLMLECESIPTRTLRRTRARGLATAPLSDGQLRALEARADFIKYCEDLRAGPLEQARAKFRQRFPQYIDAHAQALQLATEAKDYKAMAFITEPVLNRVIPVRSEAQPAAQVNIVLTPGQMQGVSATYVAPVVEVEEALIDSSSADPHPTD